MHKTLFASELEAFGKQANTLAKLMSPDTLRKHGDGCSASLLADLDREIGALSKQLERMQAAFPAFERWARFGIPDPNGIDAPPRPRDPLMPIMDYGMFNITEKFRAKPGEADAKLTKLAFPEQPHQRRVYPAASVDAYLAHNPPRRRD
jgi:hypothetical protein